MPRRDIESRAKRRVAAKKSFIYHFGIYCIMAIFFFAMNMLTDPYDTWFYFPLLPWGVGLGIHYLTTFGLPGMDMERWEERQMERERSRLERIEGNKPISRSRSQEKDYLDERLELREIRKDKMRGEKGYDDGELV